MKRTLHRPESIVALAIGALLLVTMPGCDLLGIGGGPCYRGVVVDAETGAGIGGIHMSLKVGSGGFGNYSIVAFSFTESDGRFRLCDSERRSDMGSLYANSPDCYGAENCPINRSYYGYGPVFYTDRNNIRIELQRTGP